MRESLHLPPLLLHFYFRFPLSFDYPTLLILPFTQLSFIFHDDLDLLHFDSTHDFRNCTHPQCCLSLENPL